MRLGISPYFDLRPRDPLFSEHQGWRNEQDRRPLVAACSSSSSGVSCRPSRPQSHVGAVVGMRAPLGRAAVFAALLALSTCLTGKEMPPEPWPAGPGPLGLSTLEHEASSADCGCHHSSAIRTSPSLCSSPTNWTLVLVSGLNENPNLKSVRDLDLDVVVCYWSVTGPTTDPHWCTNLLPLTRWFIWETQLEQGDFPVLSCLLSHTRSSCQS